MRRHSTSSGLAGYLSESELNAELHSARRVRSHPLAEEWRCNHADVRQIVRVIERIEAAEADAQIFWFACMVPEQEHVRQVDV